MKLGASQQLTYHPAAIALHPSDEVLVLLASGEQPALHAYNHDLSPTWSQALRKPASAIIAADGVYWALEESGVLAFTGQGECVARIALKPREGLHPASFAVLKDSLVVAWEHHQNASAVPPIVERVAFDGLSVWSTVLPMGTVAYEGVVEMRADEAWVQHPMPAWKPETWVSNLAALPVSGDLLLASFSEMPRSGIGMGYVVSLADGLVRFTTKKGPIDEITPLGNGVFLVGYQGYGAFETLQYGASGCIEDRWSSHGYCVPEGDGIRVIEMENVLPSRSHLARLGQEGHIEKGDLLPGYYTSRPHRHPSGTLIFLRHGAAHVASGLRIIKSLRLPGGNESFYSPVVGAGKAAFCAYSSVGAGHSRETSLVRVDL